MPSVVLVTILLALYPNVVVPLGRVCVNTLPSGSKLLIVLGAAVPVNRLLGTEEMWFANG